MSTSLPEIEDPIMTPDCTSKSSSLSFDVPLCTNKRLKGLNIAFKYTIQGDDDWVWFAKISTPSGVDLMYNPKVFGKPVKVGTWLSYWPIGESLHVGDKVNVSILVLKGLEIHECSAGLVYTDEEPTNETLQEDESVQILGGELSGFQLSTGAYYLCRRDFNELMEVGKLAPDWFRILVGDSVDYAEVGRWRKTGRPEKPYHSYTEVKTVGCIIYGPELEENYRITDLSNPPPVQNTAHHFANWTPFRTLATTDIYESHSVTEPIVPEDKDLKGGSPSRS